jgi:hypothetical protein
MLKLTDNEKNIYNCYLKHSRQGQPYKFRKDFSELDQNTVVSLKKISNLLSKYRHITYEDYFKAPNEIHPGEKYPSISFFASLAATKTYTIYKRQQEDIDPEKQIDHIKESFRFIGMFCLENKITLEKYSTHRTGYILSWLNHYREHRINPYSLMEINGIFSSLMALENDEVELFAKNLNEKLVAYKSRYNNSKITKALVTEATNKIKNFIKNNLQSSSTMLI